MWSPTATPASASSASTFNNPALCNFAATGLDLKAIGLLVSLDRRQFLHLSAGAIAAQSFPMPLDNRLPSYKAIVFDAFPVFDPRPMAAVTEAVFPGQGTAITAAWRVRQFEYQWLRALGGQYQDFLTATRDALVFTARQLRIDMSPAQQDALMAPWSALQVWPDAADNLTELHRAGFRLAFLSNMTSAVLADGLRRANLERLFEAVISTDSIRSYKPDQRAYRLGVEQLRLPKEEILFVAFAGWDAAGAKWFGYPTFWANRANSPAEELGVTVDAAGPDLTSLTRHVRR